MVSVSWGAVERSFIPYFQAFKSLMVSIIVFFKNCQSRPLSRNLERIDKFSTVSSKGFKAALGSKSDVKNSPKMEKKVKPPSSFNYYAQPPVEVYSEKCGITVTRPPGVKCHGGGMVSVYPPKSFLTKSYSGFLLYSKLLISRGVFRALQFSMLLK